MTGKIVTEVLTSRTHGSGYENDPHKKILILPHIIISV